MPYRSISEFSSALSKSPQSKIVGPPTFPHRSGNALVRLDHVDVGLQPRGLGMTEVMHLQILSHDGSRLSTRPQSENVGAPTSLIFARPSSLRASAFSAPLRYLFLSLFPCSPPATHHSPLSLTIPVLTQKQGVGGIPSTASTDNSLAYITHVLLATEIQNVGAPTFVTLRTFTPKPENRSKNRPLRKLWAVGCELSTVNCDLANWRRQALAQAIFQRQRIAADQAGLAIGRAPCLRGAFRPARSGVWRGRLHSPNRRWCPGRRLVRR